jgi:hypothetical protein
MLNWLVEQKSIAPHIPVNNKSKRDDGTLSRNDFKYDPTSNLYRCPGGKQLKTSGTVHEGKTLLYRASRDGCGICPLKPQCCPNADHPINGAAKLAQLSRRYCDPSHGSHAKEGFACVKR